MQQKAGTFHTGSLNSATWLSYFLALLLVGLGACRALDGDENFVPNQAGTFVLVELVNDSSTVLYVTGEGKVDTFWSEVRGLRYPRCLAYDGNNDILWVGDSARNTLYRYRHGRSAHDATIFTRCSPNAVAIGQHHIICATAREDGCSSLIFAKRSDRRDRRTIDVAYQARYLLLNRGKVWVVANDSVMVYDEQAATLEATVPVPFPVIDASFDQNFRLELTLNNGGQRRRYRINNFSYEPLRNPQEVNYRKRRVSTLRKQHYGREFLGEAILQNSGELVLSKPGFPLGAPVPDSILDFDISYFFSDVFFIRNDSLFRQHLPSGDRTVVLTGVAKVLQLGSAFRLRNK